MNIVLLVDISIQAIVFLIIFRLLDKRDSSESDRTEAILDTYASTVSETIKTFMEQVALTEKHHFEQLEKQSTKQLQVMEKQTKDFLTSIADIAAAFKPDPVPFPMPDLLDKSQRENTIEKEELPETFLDEMPRIPLADGLKVKFEDDEEIYPIHIEH